MTEPVADGGGLAAFLGSLQLADSFFPSGLYALSHGLEEFVHEGHLKAGGLEALLAGYLRQVVAPSDGTALACAHRAAETGCLDLAAEADARLTAVKLTREARTASQRTGGQLLKTALAVFGGDVLRDYAGRAQQGVVPANHAVVLGLIMAVLGVERERAVAGELYAFTASAVGAAVRLAFIDHRFAQAVLHALKPLMAQLARVHCERGVADISSTAPMVDVMAMRHERADLRLFVS